jgi:hypothetical protein
LQSFFICADSPCRSEPSEENIQEDESMKTNTPGTTWRNARVRSTSILAAMILAVGSAGFATANDNNRSVFVSGNSAYAGCGVEESDFALAMTGDLEGCLSVFVEGFKCKALDDYDLYSERGREVFVGNLHGKQGRFKTTYTFDAAMAKGFCQSFDLSMELAGGCTHKVQGRSGVFRNAEGMITFFDVIANVTGNPVTGEFTAGTGANNFLYYGRIRLDR